MASVGYTASCWQLCAPLYSAANGTSSAPTRPLQLRGHVLAVACTLGKALILSEGVAVSPDGANVYAVSYAPGSIDVFDRTAPTAALMEKRGPRGCLIGPLLGCSRAHDLRGASSVVVSPDGRNVYAVAFGSNAVDVFKRQT